MLPNLISQFMMAWNGDRDKLIAWLDKNQNKIDDQTFKEKKTLLMISVKNCWDVIVKLLLQRNVNLTLKNAHGETAIDMANQYGAWMNKR